MAVQVHDHAHEHGSGDSHSHGSISELRKANSKSLMWVAGLTGSFMITELVVGLLTHSLAILADAGHMLGDVAAVALALVASWFASKPASEAKTYGYYRTEILASTINAVAMLLISGFIAFEAVARFTHPEILSPLPMIATGIAGGIINIICVKLLSKGAEHSLNAKAAYLEVLSDLLASAGVVVAGLVIHFTGFQRIDAIVSFIIAIALLPRTWALLSQCVHILMEGTPDHVTIKELREKILTVDGVVEIHDLHVWTITSGMAALSAHVLLDEQGKADSARAAINDVLEHSFGITHSTIQTEVVSCAHKPCT